MDHKALQVSENDSNKAEWTGKTRKILHLAVQIQMAVMDEPIREIKGKSKCRIEFESFYIQPVEFRN